MALTQGVSVLHRGPRSVQLFLRLFIVIVGLGARIIVDATKRGGISGRH